MSRPRSRIAASPARSNDHALKFPLTGGIVGAILNSSHDGSIRNTRSRHRPRLPIDPVMKGGWRRTDDGPTRPAGNVETGAQNRRNSIQRPGPLPRTSRTRSAWWHTEKRPRETTWVRGGDSEVLPSWARRSSPGAPRSASQSIPGQRAPVERWSFKVGHISATSASGNSCPSPSTSTSTEPGMPSARARAWAGG